MRDMGPRTMSPRNHVPIRTCIVCGTRRRKHELVRLVLNEQGEIREDPRQKARGRGAYLCARNECRSRLKTHRRLNRVFRAGGPLRLSRELRDGA